MRNLSCCVFCFILLASFSCFSSPTAPPPSTWGDFYIDGVDYPVLPSPYTLAASGGTRSLGYWAVALSGVSPAMYAQAWAISNSTGGYGSAEFDLHETYYYRIVTPSPDNIPVSWSFTGRIYGTAGAAAPGDEGLFYAYGNLDGQGDSPWYEFSYECVNAAVPWQNCSSYNFTDPGSQSGYVPPNTWIVMKMYMNGGVEADNVGSGILYDTYLDPTVTIDSAWLAAHPGSYVEYSVPASPTPDPTNLLLFSTGLMGAVAAIGRKIKL